MFHLTGKGYCTRVISDECKVFTAVFFLLCEVFSGNVLEIKGGSNKDDDKVQHFIVSNGVSYSGK